MSACKPRLKIVSGGQSGVDRAALDAAIAIGFDYGGRCPRGGWAEDLTTPPGLLGRYPALKETLSPDPAQRTRWNIRDSDAILFLAGTAGMSVSRGTRLAREEARRLGKPQLLVRLNEPDRLDKATKWLLLSSGVQTLNVGGPRESESPGIYEEAFQFLCELFGALAHA
jgi:hypothetical protein